MQWSKEEQAMINRCANLENGDEIVSLWREFETGETREAQFVKRLDKLEMTFQAHEYGITYPVVNLSEFWDGTDRFALGELQEMYNRLEKSR